MLEVHAILHRQRCYENMIEKTGILSDAYGEITMKKVKLIIEIVKFIGLLAHLLEAFEFIESFIKRRTQKKVNPVGFKTEE